MCHYLIETQNVGAVSVEQKLLFPFENHLHRRLLLLNRHRYRTEMSQIGGMNIDVDDLSMRVFIPMPNDSPFHAVAKMNGSSEIVKKTSNFLRTLVTSSSM